MVRCEEGGYANSTNGSNATRPRRASRPDSAMCAEEDMTEREIRNAASGTMIKDDFHQMKYGMSGPKVCTISTSFQCETYLRESKRIISRKREAV
jgi:hypothetical protein